MTIGSTMDVIVAAPKTDEGSYVDWAAIIAGIVLASAISVVLLAFGTAVGLNFASFRAGEGVSPVWIAIAAGTWLVWVEVSSFMAGAYLTGRLRRRHNDATEDEVDVRDGAHGLLVWAGALVVGALIVAGGITGIAGAVGSAASTLTTAASNVADDASGAVNPGAYFVDTLFRPADNATAAASTTAAPADATAAAPANSGMAPAADNTAVRDEAGRILTQSAVAGSVSDADRAYLGQLVARNTGMTDEQATARVDQVLKAVDGAKAKAAEVAETARRSAVVGAFITAAALLLGAVGAFWAAQQGGQHRDNNVLFGRMFSRL